MQALRADRLAARDQFIGRLVGQSRAQKMAAAAIGRQADLDVGHDEACVVGGDDQVAGQDQ